MRIIPLILFLIFILGVETYTFFGLKSSLSFEGKKLLIANAITLAITFIGIILLILSFQSDHSTIKLHVNLIFGLALSFMLAKLAMSSLFVVEDIFRGFTWFFQSAFKFRLAEMTSRSMLSGVLAIVVGSSFIIFMNYGVWFGRYQFKTHHQVIEYENLPEEFNGFKIAQLSDMHLGTFDQLKRVKQGLNQLQNEKPDLILFTGDMVNNRAEEVVPFIDMMRKLEAPYGKFSVLGNHDYGEYVRWKSEHEKNDNLERLKGFQKQMGFNLLLNQQVKLNKNNASIYIAGVENWGTPPFPQFGVLEKAVEGRSSDDFIVLLSHDPTHWREKVISSPIEVDLTLSGHTHGMQFGIEIGKFKWSPVKYRYPDWAGLFTNKNSHLYVNRGFGNIGFPGRVGIWPEITIIELRKK